MFDILPLRVIPPVVFGSICYFMVGLRPDMEHFLKFQLVLVLFNLAVAAICLLIAISHGNNIGLANLTSVVVLLMSMTFGGFFLNKRMCRSASKFCVE